jgi:hypothetical protein
MIEGGAWKVSVGDLDRIAESRNGLRPHLRRSGKPVI